MKINKDYLFDDMRVKAMKLSAMKAEGFTLHNTGNRNISSALDEAKNYYNNNYKKGDRAVIVHFTVDEENIYQHIPINVHGWHASDGANGFGNRKTIAIEIARDMDYNSDRYQRAELLTVELIKYLHKEFGVPLNLKRHHDYDSGRQLCPHRMFEAKPNTWEQFVALVNNKQVEKPVDKPVEKPKTTIAEVAKDVINGKYGNGLERKTNLEKVGYNYLEVQTEVNRQLGIKPNEPTKPVLKPIKTIAQEVINGLWGNGYDRKNRLTKAGYDYNAVQAQVNELLKQPVAKPKLTAKQVAHEIVYGKNKYGNGNARKIALEKEGYDYNEVQNEVNKLMYK